MAKRNIDILLENYQAMYGIDTEDKNYVIQLNVTMDKHNISFSEESVN